MGPSTASSGRHATEKSERIPCARWDPSSSFPRARVFLRSLVIRQKEIEPMRSLKHLLKSFLHQEDGPTTVEYAVMLSLIITVVWGAVSTVGTKTNSSFVAAAKGFTASSS